MSRPEIADEVAAQLDRLADSRGPHDPEGPNSTIARFTETVRVRRGARITEEYLGLQPDVERDGRAAVVTAGSPGAGKSTALEDSGFDTQGFRDIDPDRIKTLLLRDALNDGTFEGLLRRTLADGGTVRPMELASLVHRESTIIAQNVAEISMRRGDNVIIQGTLAWDQQPQRLLETFDVHEYADLTILDVEVDLPTALERVCERWWVGRNNPSNPLGGRFVPSELVRGLYLGGTSSRCQTNAEVMFELSTRMTTVLRTETTIHGVRSQTVRRLDSVPGRIAVPSLGDN